MNRFSVTSWLLCACLVLALCACGNKGPLVQPDEEQEKKTKSTSSY